MFSWMSEFFTERERLSFRRSARQMLPPRMQTFWHRWCVFVCSCCVNVEPRRLHILTQQKEESKLQKNHRQSSNRSRRPHALAAVVRWLSQDFTYSLEDTDKGKTHQRDAPRAQRPIPSKYTFLFKKLEKKNRVQIFGRPEEGRRTGPCWVGPGGGGRVGAVQVWSGRGGEAVRAWGLHFLNIGVRAHAASQGLCDNVINSSKLLTKQQKDGDSPVEKIVTGLREKSRKGWAQGVHRSGQS